MKPSPVHLLRNLSYSLLALFALSGASASPGTYLIAPSTQSEAEFRFRVTLIPVPGKTSDITARLIFDPQNLRTASGTVGVGLTQLETGISLRDQHAKNALKAEAHPKATFVLERWRNVPRLTVGKEAKGVVEGRFTLGGITKKLSAPVSLRLEQDQRVFVTTTFEVVLSDYDINVAGADPKTDVTVTFVLQRQ